MEQNPPVAFPNYNRSQIKWVISNFTSDLLRNPRFDDHQSNAFSIPFDGCWNSEWQLVIYRNHSALSCYLKLSTKGWPAASFFKDVLFTWKLGIVNHCYVSEDKITWKCRGECDKFDYSVRLGKLFNHRELTKGHNEHTWVNNKKLTLVLRLDMVKFSKIPSMPKSVSVQYEKFFKNEKLSDFTLVTADGDEIPVHKCILSIRSPVFETMMETNMREHKEKKAVVEDIPGPAFIEFLRYIYCGRIEKMDEFAVELLYAATKYDVPDLIPFCVKSLVAKLSLANVIETMMLADLHAEHDLKEFCIDFIDWNYAELKDCEGWKVVPQVIYKEILDKVMISKKNIKAASSISVLHPQPATLGPIIIAPVAP